MTEDTQIRITLPSLLWEQVTQEAAGNFRTPRQHLTMLVTQMLARHFRPREKKERAYPLPVDGNDFTGEPTFD